MSKVYIISMETGYYPDEYGSTVICVISEKEMGNIQGAISFINGVFNYDTSKELEKWDEENPEPFIKKGPKTKEYYKEHDELRAIWIKKRYEFASQTRKQFINSLNFIGLEKFIEFAQSNKFNDLDTPNLSVEEMEVSFKVQDNDSGNDCLNKIIDYITKQ